MRLRVPALFLVVFCAVLLFGITGSLQAASTTQPMVPTSGIMTPDQVKAGMTGYGLTVFKGNKIEPFKLTVIGVMRHIEFDADLILIRITSGPVVTRNWGIIAGMSGSPIYINGKLIGALAFSWSFSKEPIAGVTPIRQMAENFLPGSVGPMQPLNGDKAPRPVAASTLVPRNGPIQIGNKSISRAQIYSRQADSAVADPHTMALVPVATPIMVSGLGSTALKELAKVLHPYGLMAMPGGGKSPIKLSVTPKPGDAVGVQLVGGDIDMTAVGTVTYVKDGKILAMGHPFMGIGPVDLPMVNAYVHGVLPNQDNSFKLASGGQAIIGRWAQDRPWSLGGYLGEKPSTFPGTLDLWDKERGLKKHYSVYFARQRDVTASLVASTTGEAVKSIIPANEGTLKVSMEVSAPGLPTIRRENMYSQAVESSGGLLAMLLGGRGGAGSPTSDMLELANTLESNPYQRVFPTRIAMSAEWSKDRSAAAIEQVRARTKRVRPGDKVDVDVLIQPWGKPKETRTVQIEIPQNAPAGRLQVGIAGGMSARSVKSRLQISDPAPTNLAQAWNLLTRDEKNNDLMVAVGTESSGLELQGKQIFNLPPVVTEVFQAANDSDVRIVRDSVRKTISLPYVLSGSEVLTFTVETDEKDKAGRAPTPGMGSSMDSGMGSGSMKGMLDMEGDMAGDEMQAPPAGDANPPSGGNPEATVDDSPPEMPSWDEVADVEKQEADSITTDKSAADTPAKPKTVLRAPGIWQDTTEKDFAKGKVFGAAVNTAGTVDLAPNAKSLFTAHDGLLWAAAADGKGNLYVGSWVDGKVRKIAANGATSTVLTTTESAVQALTFDRAGNLYAGTIPSGTIYRISPEGKTTTFAKLDNYIWALLSTPTGLLAATGPEGKLFRIDADGKAQLVFQTPDRHVIALAGAPSGPVYAATYPKGKVYRIDGDKVAPFYETVAGVTALSLAVDKAGNVLVGTSPEGRVILIDPQSKARLLYKSPERHIFSLWPAEDGTVYAATGPKARIYRIFSDGNAAMIWEAKNGHVVSLTANSGQLNATLGGARQVLGLEIRGAADGNYLSSVYDATGPARWGQIRWQADQPANSSVMLQTRSGNTAWPDTTWSDWSAPYTSPTGEKITSPVARYLQYRAALKSADAARPTLRQVDAFYMTENRAPELKLTAPSQSPVWNGKKSIKWSATDPDKDTLTYQVFYSGDQGQSWTEVKEPIKKSESTDKSKAPKADEKTPAATPATKENKKPAKAAAVEEKKASATVSEATGVKVTEKKAEAATTTEESPADKDKDKEAKTEDKPAAPTQATSMSWDTSKVADGIYTLKVIASDKLSNPKEPMSDEKVSEPLRIDNTAPTIGLDKTKTTPSDKVTITDAGTYVASVEYQIDGGEWHGALAEDGIYDGLAEVALIDAADLPAGQHTLKLRVKDGVGNEATSEVKYSKP